MVRLTNSNEAQINQLPENLRSMTFKADSIESIAARNFGEIPYHSLMAENKFNSNSLITRKLDEKKEIDWSAEAKEIYEAFNKIPPIDENIVKLGLALSDGDKYPEKIDKELVHKKNIDNVIISKARRLGNIWYFNMLENGKEFNFDHESDHLQGMLLVEAARQTGIATVHLNGLPKSGKLNMSSMYTKFSNYVECGSPVVIRSASNPIIFYHSQHAKCYVVVDIMQFGKVCTTSFLEGVMFKTEAELLEYRVRSIKINERKKIKYRDILDQIHHG